MGFVLKARKVNTHEPDGFPVADRTYFLHRSAVATERYFELIPRYLLCLTVAKSDVAHFLLGDMLAAHLHHIGSKDDAVLVVFLVFIERVIEVDILHIRLQGSGCTVALVL